MTRIRLSEAVHNAIETLRDTAGWLDTVGTKVAQEAASDLRHAAADLTD